MNRHVHPDSSSSAKCQGVASALNDTVREMGGALGVALFGSLLNAQYRSNVKSATVDLAPDLAERVEEGIGGALGAAGQLGPDGGPLLAAARDAWLDGMRPAMWLAAGLAVAAAVYTGWSATHHYDVDVAAGDTEPPDVTEVTT